MLNKSPSSSGKSAAGGAASRKRRSRGRPKAASAEHVREALMNASRDLFLRYGYRNVSSRQIADAAGANVAMIRYYFGGKPGLYKEMLQGVLHPMRARLDAMVCAGGPIELSEVLANLIRGPATNPWVVGLVLREVLSPDGPLRGMFLREGPERLLPVVERIVQSEMARGKVRSDIDSRLLILSLASLAIFPFLAFPITSKLFGVRNDEEFLKKYLKHTTQLLAHGVGGNP
jgi:TetR/AcrR family transcriptional regulator